MNRGLAKGLDSSARLGLKLFPTSDTYTSSDFGSTNYDTSTTITIRWFLGGGSYTSHTFMTFDISTLAGMSLHEARIRLVSHSSPGTGGGSTTWIRAKEVLRLYNPTQVTFNSWQTGSGWSGTGGSGSGTDVSEATYGACMVPGNIANSEYMVDVTPLLQKAIDVGQGTLRLILFANVTTSGNPCNFYSLESTIVDYRPCMLLSPGAP